MDLSKYVGKIFDDATKEEITLSWKDTTEILWQVIIPGSVVTADYRTDRIRVTVNNFTDMEIVRIRVG